MKVRACKKPASCDGRAEEASLDAEVKFQCSSHNQTNHNVLPLVDHIPLDIRSYIL